MRISSQALLVLLAFAAPAHAGGLYIEGPGVGNRSEAAEMVRLAGVPGRVVRRLHHGLGWEYVPRFEGFGSAGEAEAAARAIADSVGRGVSVYEVDGSQARRVGVQEPDLEGSSGARDPAPAAADVHELLQRVARAHGGVDGGAAAVARADAVDFRFVRDAEGRTVRHVWARRGQAHHLQVQIEGSESDITVDIAGNGASLTTTETTEVSSARARALVERLAPERILAFPLQLSQALASDHALSELHAGGTERVGGRPCRRLSWTGDRVAGAVALWVDVDRDLVRRVEARDDAGLLRWSFGDYREVEPGLVVPFLTEITRDSAPIDRIEIEALELAPTFPDGWFEPPG